MLSMVNVNRYIFKLGFPIVLVLYLIFLVYDRSQWDDGGRLLIVSRHVTNVAKINHIDAVITGGSNALFSLSAEQLSDATNYAWYNAALLNEGFSGSNYHKFLTTIFNEKLAANVKLVVYSTVYPYRVGEIKQRSDYNGPVNGRGRLGIKPDRNALSHIKKWINGDAIEETHKRYPEPTRFGDLNFDAYDCDDFPSEDIKFERENSDMASEEIARNIIFFKHIFPNAKLVLVFPSEFYGDSLDMLKLVSYNHAIIEGVSKVLGQSDVFMRNPISFISQPPFPDSYFICDARHHASRKGREWRSQNLASMLLSPE